MIFGEVLADPLYLVVNCAETRLQVVLGGLQGCAWSESFHAPGRAMPLLAPSIARGLHHFGINAGGLRGIAYVRGPGSFTGLRMSIAHVLGLSQAANVPVAGLDYLPLLAVAPALLVNGPLWCIVHSRQKQVYAQKFDCPQKMPAGMPRVFSVHEMRLELAGSGDCRVLGSGVSRNPELIPEDSRIDILPEIFNNPGADILLRAACESQYSHTFTPPLYLRPSDAEENLEAIASRRGMDAAWARREIESE